MYLESDMLDLRPRVCFGSQAKSAFGTKNMFGTLNSASGLTQLIVCFASDRVWAK